ncbi:MAG: zinc-dependent metalloprotease [Candidatus Symbiothrix sp.]|jgi:hypothetical protein|nr:zinc-dependent metalloprotease [Candidatus Symbiothrix sp.]
MNNDHSQAPEWRKYNGICIFILSFLLSTLPVKAQFLIGSPGQTQLQSTTGPTVAKTAYGDLFVRSGNVVLNRTNVNDQCIQTALLTQNTLSIQLFSDLTVTAQKTGVRTTTSGGIYWTGTITAETQNSTSLPPNGELTLFMLNNYLAGTLRYQSQVYDLTSDAGGNLRVVELDTDKAEPNEDCYFNAGEPAGATFAVAQSGLRAEPALRASATQENGNYIVDILVLYPPEVAAQMGANTAARTAAAQLRIEEANEIFANSQMNVRFRLAHDEINTDIILDADGGHTANISIPSVKNLRNTWGADIVTYWNYDGTSGTGTTFSGTAPMDVWNTSKYSEVITRYTFVHECGHNMGARHDRYEYVGESYLTSAPGYNFGKCFLTYRTIMAYDNSKYLPGAENTGRNRIKYFSNPDVNYNGVPTGVAFTGTFSTAGDGGPADNARRINECVPYVSAINDPVVTSSSIKYVVPDGAGNKDGSSWANAKATIKAAYDLADATEVHVKMGSYPFESITLKPGVHLKGGYTGTGDEREINPANTVWNGGASSANRFITAPTAGLASTEVSGLTFTGNTTTANGGAVSVVLEGTSSVDLLFKSCVFSNNTASSGTIYVNGTANNTGIIAFENCIISKNQATSSSACAAGLYSSNAAKINISLINCTVVGNTAPNYTGTSGSGGIAIRSADANVLSNVLFAANIQGTSTSSNYRKGSSATVTESNNLQSTTTDIFVDYTNSDFRLKSTASNAINAGSTTAGQFTAADILGRTKKGTRDIGAYEGGTIVIAPGASVSTIYDTTIHNDVVFQSDDDNGTGEWILNAPTTIDGTVQLVKTFTEKQWYPIGFPFALAGVIDNTPGTYFGEKLKAFDGTEGDFWLKSYSHNASTSSDGTGFAPKSAIALHEGYIIQFPSFYKDQGKGDQITVLFTSTANPTLSNTNINSKLSSTYYTLVANPSVGILTGIDAATHHYPYTGEKFLLTTSALEVKPFEALIAANLSSGVSPVTAIGDLDSEGLTTGLDSRITATSDSNDPVVETNYYTTQGIEVQKPSATGVYIVKEIHASQKATVTKTIY